MIALKDFEKGETIFKETPLFITFSNKLESKVCEYCMENKQSVKCMNCDTFYCSVECELNAWNEYHQKLCNNKEYLNMYKTQNDKIIFKIFSKTMLSKKYPCSPFEAIEELNYLSCHTFNNEIEFKSLYDHFKKFKTILNFDERFIDFGSKNIFLIK
jgi:hypothetical protein